MNMHVSINVCVCKCVLCGGGGAEDGWSEWVGNNPLD